MRHLLTFLVAFSARSIDDSVTITPLRQEQLKDRLGDRFFELDVPLLATWPDGRREALLYVIEEETDPRRFSIHRLAIYCLTLGELMKLDRVVPVVIFLKGRRAKADADAAPAAEAETEAGAGVRAKGGASTKADADVSADAGAGAGAGAGASMAAAANAHSLVPAANPVTRSRRKHQRRKRHTIPESLTMGSETQIYLQFRYLACVLPELLAQDFWESDNIVARICLPILQWAHEQKLQVYAQALDGILALESSTDKRLKYVDFVDTYLPLDAQELHQYRETYEPKEDRRMGYNDMLRAEGRQEGLQAGRHEGLLAGRMAGMQEGRQEMLARQLHRRFGALDADTESRLKSASIDELNQWIDNILDARSIEEVFGNVNGDGTQSTA